MEFKKREKTYAIIAGSVIGLMVLYWLFSSTEGAVADLQKKYDDAVANAEKNRNRALRALKAKEQLTAWQKRALPAEQEVARPLYQNWLRTVVDREFPNGSPKVNSHNTQANQAARREEYSFISFDVTCDGTLEQLTKFLHEFYSAGTLHKIRSMDIKPASNNSSTLNIHIVVDVMSMAGATNKDKLTTEPSKRLKLASFQDYKKSIVTRNLLAPYSPPKPERDRNDRRGPSENNPAKTTYLTAIVDIGGTNEAWFLQPSGETLRLREGDDFKVGTVSGRVVRFGHGEVELEIDGKTRTISYGDSLMSGGF